MKSNYLMQLASLVLFITLQSGGCKKDEFVSSAIGTVGPAGGIIFYDKGHYSNDWRYLEAAPNDLPGLYKFGCMIPSVPDNYGVFIGDGEYNTFELVQVQSDVYQSSTTTCNISDFITASKACDDFSLNGYDDWFLPAHDEFKEMAQKIGLERGNIGNLYIQSYYWTSSIGYDLSDWRISRPKVAWGNGDDPAEFYKWMTTNAQADYRVRPIRAF